MNNKENLNSVYSMIHKVGETVYVILSTGDLGYDGTQKDIYRGKILQVTVAMRNGIRDYYAKIQAQGYVVNIWSNDVSEKIFSREEDAKRRLEQLKKGVITND